jgi:hypothetical protein
MALREQREQIEPAKNLRKDTYAFESRNRRAKENDAAQFADINP